MVAWQGDVAATAEHELCAAEQSGGVLGLVEARCLMGEAQGGRGGLNEGAGVLGVRATGRAGEISGEMGGVRWRAGEGRGRRAMTGGPGCAGREATRGAGERAERGVRRRQVGPAAQVGRARGAGGMAVERACWAGVRCGGKRDGPLRAGRRADVRAQEGVASWAVKAGPGAVEGFGPGAGWRWGRGAGLLGCLGRVDFGFLPFSISIFWFSFSYSSPF